MSHPVPATLYRIAHWSQLEQGSLDNRVRQRIQQVQQPSMQDSLKSPQRLPGYAELALRRSPS